MRVTSSLMKASGDRTPLIASSVTTRCRDEDSGFRLLRTCFPLSCNKITYRPEGWKHDGSRRLPCRARRVARRELREAGAAVFPARNARRPRRADATGEVDPVRCGLDAARMAGA